MQLVEALKNRWREAVDGELRMQLVIMVAAILFLTIAAPFGMTRMSVFDRLVYWSVCIPVGFGGAWGYSRWLHPVFIRRGWQRASSLAQIICINIAAISSAMVMEALLREPIPLRYLGLLAGYVLVITAAVWGVVLLSIGPGVKPREDEAEDPALLAFRERWPAELREAELKAMTAEDHYIRLYTSQGEALIAGRFNEALEAVASLPGSQVHRSWWVAGEAVRGLDRSGGNWRLDLGEDLAVPVSRRFRPDVRAKGWDRLGV